MPCLVEDELTKVNFNSMCKLIPSLCLEFPFAAKLNSTARQASAERAWLAISRFFANCKNKVVGKKGYPQFKKFSRSVEYKKSGWKLSVDEVTRRVDRKYLTITDKTGIGKLKLIGTYDLPFGLTYRQRRASYGQHYYQLKQINRVRLVRRADGYYAQFCIDQERLEDYTPTGKSILAKALSTVGHTETNASGQTDLYLISVDACVSPKGKLVK